MRAIALRCGFLENPIGISREALRLSWRLMADGYAKRQSAYRVQCSPRPDAWPEDGLLWDSGVVASDGQVGLRYGGEVLGSRGRAYWRVKVWDELGVEGPWSETAFFELGLLRAGDWKARWIDPEPPGRARRGPRPASYLGRRFFMARPARKARLYVTARGLYIARINGRSVSDAVLLPGCTNYGERLQVQAWDVGGLLRPGENRVDAVLGDGWYRGRVGLLGRRKLHGDRVALLAQLEYETDAGEEGILVSDGSWEATQDGPIRAADLKDGEVYDARMTPTAWHPVREADYGYGNLVCSDAPPVVERERIVPEVLRTPDDKTVLDFGQNLAGYVEFTLRAEAGRRVRLVHGEVLDASGNFTMENIRVAVPGVAPLKQEVTYIASGRGPETYKPSFTYHGFRYVLLEDWPEEVVPGAFRAIAIRSALAETADFSCSEPLVNRLFSNVLWSQRGNFVDIPTDCPQRERAGWTGDIQVFARAGCYLMDCAAFLEKWLKDLAAQQREDGRVPNIVPSVGFERSANPLLRAIEGSAGWGDAAVIVPWTLWRAYGDRSVLEAQWDSMAGWVEYAARCAERTHWARRLAPNPFRRFTWDTKYHWGEWLEPGSEGKIIEHLLFSEPEVATAYLAYSSGLLAEMAEALGKAGAAHRYRDLAEGARSAYRYLYASGGKVDSDRQCRHVRPVALGLVEAAEADALVERLEFLVRENDCRIGTGFLSTGLVCKALSDRGHAETAYRLLTQDEMPGWMSQIRRGATTIWESWDGMDRRGSPRGSHNHYASGAVAAWLVDTVAGIDYDPAPDAAGFRRFVLAPKPGGGLTWARCAFDSVRGRIESSWAAREEGTSFVFEIPVNSSARIVLPCGDPAALRIEEGEVMPPFVANGRGAVEATVGSGRYRIMSLARRGAQKDEAPSEREGNP